MDLKFILLTLAVGVSLLFAGCTASNGGDEEVLVELKGTKFVPDEREVEPGTTVTWINRDPVQHDVVATDGSFKSEFLRTGGVFENTFDTPGVYEYYCSVPGHSTVGDDGERRGMVGTIIVLNEDGSQPGADNGTADA